jgi:hypothetical protein
MDSFIFPPVLRTQQTLPCEMCSLSNWVETKWRRYFSDQYIRENTYICDHRESDEKGENAHTANEYLSPVTTAKVIGECINNGSHEAFNTNKLKCRGIKT